MAPADGTLGSRFIAPLVTWLVADACGGDRSLEAIEGTMRALERVGVSRGRQFVLLGGETIPEAAAATARVWRLHLGVPVLVHDPSRDGFIAGDLPDGTPLELDDELREAEAIVSVAGGSAWARASAIVPGACTARTREALARANARGGPAAAWAFVREAERLAPIDLAVSWDESGEPWVAGGRHALEHWERLALGSGGFAPHADAP